MKKLKKKLWLISGIMLIIIGIICLFLMGVSMKKMSFYLGTALLITGIVNLIYLIDTGNKLPGTGWVIYDAVINIFLALFLFSADRWTFLLKAVPYFFAVAIITKGVVDIIDANQSRYCLDRYWYINLIVGICSIVFGILCVVFPMVGIVSVSIVAGVALMISGFSTLGLWFFEHRFRKKVQRLLIQYGYDINRFKNEDPEEYIHLEAMLNV